MLNHCILNVLRNCVQLNQNFFSDSCKFSLQLNGFWLQFNHICVTEYKKTKKKKIAASRTDCDYNRN